MLKFLYILIDVFLIGIAELLAYIIRLGYPLTSDYLNFYYSNLFFIILIRMWSLYSINVYSVKLRSFLSISSQIIKACIFSTVIITAITFFNRSLGYPRSVILISFINISVFLLIKYYFYWKFLIIKKGRKRVIIIGATESGKNIIKSDFTLKYCELIGFIDEKIKVGRKVINNLKNLGRLNDLRKIVKKRDIELAVIAIPNYSTENKLKILTKCEDIGLNYIIIPSFYEIVTGRARLDEIDDMAVLEPALKSANLLNKLIKRLFDFIFSFVVLVVLIPLFILISLLIKVSSKGSVIYKQPRAGRNGKPFYVYKFRTMIEKADKIGPKLTRKNDKRVTRIGALLRRWSMDELPQFYNVLKGDMSVVGPRPEVVEIVKKYRAWQRKVLNIKPGITGYAQISGRQELEIDTKLQMDLYYINNYSLLLDIEIIFKTIITIFKGEGAF